MRQSSAALRLLSAIDMFKASARGDDQHTDLVKALDDISSQINGSDEPGTPGDQATAEAGPKEAGSDLAEKLKSMVRPPAAPTDKQPDDFKDAAQKAVDVLQTAIAGGPGPESAGTAPPAPGGES